MALTFAGVFEILSRHLLPAVVRRLMGEDRQDFDWRYKTKEAFLDAVQEEIEKERAKAVTTSGCTINAKAECPVCKTPVTVAEAVRCPKCGVPQHEDCSKLMRSCPIYGCSGAVVRLEGASAHQSPPGPVHMTSSLYAPLHSSFGVSSYPSSLQAPVSSYPSSLQAPVSSSPQVSPQVSPQAVSYQTLSGIPSNLADRFFCLTCQTWRQRGLGGACPAHDLQAR